jgi:acid phosphatase type 7
MSFSLSLSPPVSSLQYQFANFENDGYNKTGKGYLKLQLINQREDFSFALFSGGLSKVILKEKKDSTF